MPRSLKKGRVFSVMRLGPFRSEAKKPGGRCTKIQSCCSHAIDSHTLEVETTRPRLPDRLQSYFRAADPQAPAIRFPSPRRPISISTGICCRHFRCLHLTNRSFTIVAVHTPVWCSFHSSPCSKRSERSRLTLSTGCAQYRVAVECVRLVTSNQCPSSFLSVRLMSMLGLLVGKLVYRITYI
jgi:hypothetical protein